jgi:hypothetical protein
MRFAAHPVLAIIMLIGAVALGQTRGGRVSGTVVDPSGFTVAGAHVEIDSASGARWTAIRGSDGGFTINLPTAGTYTVRMESTGFVEVARVM